MSLRPGWHSTIFSPYFVATAGYSGVAILIVIMWIYRRTNHLEKYITNLHFNYLGFGLILLTFIYAYFSFSEYLTDWYNETKTISLLFAKLYDFDQFAWLSIFHIAFAFLFIL